MRPLSQGAGCDMTPPGDPIDRLSDEQVEALIDSWIPAGRADLSEHSRLEATYAIDAGHEPGYTPPLDEDDPVPGCNCTRCLMLGRTGDPDSAVVVESLVRDLARVDPSVRLQAARTARPALSDVDCPSARWLCRRAREVPGSVRPTPPAGDRDREELPVEEARRVSIVDVARRLGCGEPEGRWGEPRVLCPLHDDSNPSMRLDTDRGLWYCDPCSEGGDAIALVQAVQGVGFAEAVRWVARNERAA